MRKFFLLLVAVWSAFGQSPDEKLPDRVLAVVPMTGKGTPDDPRRPLYAPNPAQMTPGSRSGIVGYSMQLSDDGQFALVELVAANPAGLQSILSNRQIKAFSRGKHKRAEIETEFRKYKKDFDLDRFKGVRPR